MCLSVFKVGNFSQTAIVMALEGAIDEDFLLHLLLDDDEEEDALIQNILLDHAEYINEEDRRPKVDLGINLYQWRLLGDPTFPKHYRMSKQTFERLVIAVGNYFETKNINVENSFKEALDISLLMCIWALATNDTFRSIGVKFGKSESVVYHHYFKIINALVEMASKYIRWPDRRERAIIKYNLERRYGYPGVVGCIDGTHIYISAPLHQRQRYQNRHHRYSILVQAVCDHRILFRDIYVGEPGSVGDLRMFLRSFLGLNMHFREGMFSDGEHLVGDSAYPLSGKLLIPYPEGANDRRELHHNARLSSCRSLIERAFARLKNKFRRLKYIMCYSIYTAVQHIVASLVLHNFIILEGEELMNNDDYPEPEERMEPPDEEFYEEARRQGAIKREFISHLLQVPN